MEQLKKHANHLHHIKLDDKDEVNKIATHPHEEYNPLQETNQPDKQLVLANNNIQCYLENLQRIQIKNSTVTTKTPAPFTYHVKPTALTEQIIFNAILKRAINHAKRRNTILAILLIDVHSFETILAYLDDKNNTFMLQKIEERLKNVLRIEDTIAKLENNQFVILLDDIGEAKFAGLVAEKILKALTNPVSLKEEQLTVTASIGISVYPSDGESLENLWQHVIQALNKAKQVEGSAYQFYNDEIDTIARQFIQLEFALREAITHNALKLYFQPKFNLKTGNIVGAEALMRWYHPSLGLIDPNTFIPIAEKSGFIIEMGEWALNKVCKINKYWQDEGYEHLTISLNISSKQFHHPDLPNMITRILKNTGLNPHHLELEITEKVVMDDILTSAEKLENLKNTGVSIAIDHFGTGYSSISYLKKFPINSIKIDSVFIKGIPSLPNDMAITNAFISLAHHLGLEIVAEGVEAEEQVRYLANQGCDVVQGYFLCPPLPADKMLLQLKKLSDKVL